METNNKRINFLQYLNTTILTVILGVALMIFLTINSVKKDQSDIGKELVRLSTIQDMHILTIKDLETRITTLERNYLDNIKLWTDENYLRKSQR